MFGSESNKYNVHTVRGTLADKKAHLTSMHKWTNAPIQKSWGFIIVCMTNIGTSCLLFLYNLWKITTKITQSILLFKCIPFSMAIEWQSQLALSVQYMRSTTTKKKKKIQHFISAMKIVHICILCLIVFLNVRVSSMLP